MYGELAAARLAREPAGHTLQPTALVHDSYLRMVGGDTPWDWKGRGHFFGAAAWTGPGGSRPGSTGRPQPDGLAKGGGGRRLPPDRLLALDEAHTLLAGHDPVAGQLVHLR